MQWRDQMGRSLALSHKPQRIVSLVPSITELLYDLVPADHIVGTTFFCVHPAGKVESSSRIGGTKTLKIDKIRALKPDLIIGSKEENVKEQVEVLANEFHVWMSDVKTLNDAFDMILQLGRLLHNEAAAQSIMANMAGGFERLPKAGKRALYLIWRNPYMGAGNDTFIHEVMAAAGFYNVLSIPRYPELSLEQIQGLNPEIIFLSSEPYPFKQKHVAELAQQVPETKIELVDGELFSWYGSRLLNSPAYLTQLVERLH
jgi:ABC-type Fe3+-hydroxamate transport system substrate-binding protein